MRVMMVMMMTEVMMMMKVRMSVDDLLSHDVDSQSAFQLCVESNFAFKNCL